MLVVPRWRRPDEEGKVELNASSSLHPLTRRDPDVDATLSSAHPRGVVRMHIITWLCSASGLSRNVAISDDARPSFPTFQRFSHPRCTRLLPPRHTQTSTADSVPLIKLLVRSRVKNLGSAASLSGSESFYVRRAGMQQAERTCASAILPWLKPHGNRNRLASATI